MKSFISVIITFSLLIFAFFANYFFLRNQTQIVFDDLLLLEKYAINEDKKMLKESYNALETDWEKVSNILFIFSYHTDLEDINKCFIKIKTRIKSEDFYGIVEEVEIAKHIIKGASKKEMPTLSNIF
ncbi:MAG: DUF4363 family protein [Ruminococcaceae bacterium]|nr:DUF4363 family protein [Oscillospiraceae bacterium]